MLRELLFANRGAVTDDLRTLMVSRKINFGVRELTRALPLRFRSNGTSLLDWRITGAAGGVGKLGKNYLKLKTDPIPNGAAGTWLAYAPGFVNAVNGFTVNSGNAARLLFQIRHYGDYAVQPSHVGDIMMTEGSTIPTAYDADTTMYKQGIMQGNIVNHDATAPRTVGVTQELYCGDDGGGGTNNYIISPSNIAIRCKTYSIPVKPNTDYSVRVFNSSYNDIEFYTCYYSEPGTITPTVTACSAYTQKSIPGNDTFVEDTEQWVKLVYSHYRRSEYQYALPCDVRPVKYDYCEYFATLKAGTYKLMIDTWGNNRFSGTGGYWTGIQDYSGCVYDNFSYGNTQGNEWFTLLAEDNTVIIAKSDILPSGISSKSKRVDDGAPYPNYFHKEVTFTLQEDTKVGLFHKAYYENNSDPIPAYHRFMIVDSDVEAEEFATTGADPCNMTGYSAWEKYNVSLPVNISSRGQTQTVTVDLGDSFLGAGDTISLADTHTAIPTYSGTNIITVDSEVQPTEMYIKYVG